MQPKAYISYSPAKLGSVFALFYFEAGTDIYGWHIESRNLYFSAAFFMIEKFYAAGVPRLYRSMQDDVYGHWISDFPPAPDQIRSPIPEAIGHELERLQSRFVEEWLFFKNDAPNDPEFHEYQSIGLPINEVNIKARRLHRLQKNGLSWTYTQPGTDPNIIQLLRKYWRLSEKVPSS
jgi:hypothetical protein